jgi:SAM-dependent methyltransferase
MTDLFASAAEYYSRYRPGYPAAVIARLRTAFGLDGTERLLDLGCGTGELARLLHGDFREVVGVDKSPDMIAEAQRLSERASLTHSLWICMPAEDISAQLCHFKLVTLGNSFHWMRRAVVLDKAYDVLIPGGGVAILGNPGGIWEGMDPWEQVVREVVVRWLGPQRRTCAGLFVAEEGAEKVALTRSRFVGMEVGQHHWERLVDVDTILGELYSTSFANRALLGEKADGFAMDVGRSLLALEPTGQFLQHLRTEYIVAYKR